MCLTLPIHSLNLAQSAFRASMNNMLTLEAVETVPTRRDHVPQTLEKERTTYSRSGLNEKGMKKLLFVEVRKKECPDWFFKSIFPLAQRLSSDWSNRERPDCSSFNTVGKK